MFNTNSHLFTNTLVGTLICKQVRVGLNIRVKRDEQDNVQKLFTVCVTYSSICTQVQISLPTNVFV